MFVFCVNAEFFLDGGIKTGVRFELFWSAPASPSQLVLLLSQHSTKTLKVRKKIRCCKGNEKMVVINKYKRCSSGHTSVLFSDVTHSRCFWFDRWWETPAGASLNGFVARGSTGGVFYHSVKAIFCFRYVNPRLQLRSRDGDVNWAGPSFWSNSAIIGSNILVNAHLQSWSNSHQLQLYRRLLWLLLKSGTHTFGHVCNSTFSK